MLMVSVGFLNGDEEKAKPKTSEYGTDYDLCDKNKYWRA
tara:strand:- start:28 stop:144 length:117 start_codon:yes stop_codon:yes gene_type:complete